MDKLELRFKPVDLQTVEENEELKVEGYVNLTEQSSELLSTHTGHRFVEKISKGAFSRAIQKATEIDFLVEHDKQKILASTRNNSLDLVEDDKGLFMSATISPTTWGKDYYTLVKDGIIKNFSFGFRALIDDWSERADGILERTVNELELFEVSLVKNPAYTQSFVEARTADYLTVDEVLERGESMAENKKELLEETEEIEGTEETEAIDELSRKFDELVSLLKGKHLLLDDIKTEEIVLDESDEEDKEEDEDTVIEEEDIVEDEEERALPDDVQEDEDEKDEESLKSTILGLEMKIEKVQSMLTEVLEDKLRADEEEDKEEEDEKKEEEIQEKEEKKEEDVKSADNLKKLQDTLAGLEEFEK